ncbi:hypothetical protein K458DRAFT_92263 [Lentithecium fluviatile CBS 122367]|uniref:Uncharacterized protein n=1 Tax=Lentithecium fluviatile CBS 122367 TaxID=1168545 RepID=A0A6G1IQJ3_9PLEO|nr:hypothetical protein K458DRAFT_92263 [Lentithecium fluviatile CBS 122367]
MVARGGRNWDRDWEQRVVGSSVGWQARPGSLLRFTLASDTNDWPAARDPKGARQPSTRRRGRCRGEDADADTVRQGAGAGLGSMRAGDAGTQSVELRPQIVG